MEQSDLINMSLEELEALYLEPSELDPPQGRYDGRVLAWMRHPGARRPVLRQLEHLYFEVLPFGVDFTARLWYFGVPQLGVGRFAVQPGPSRWRATQVLRLDYSVSRLPRAIRSRLYDEIKPLGPELCLGLGGIKEPRGRGDHFFFALTRR